MAKSRCTVLVLAMICLPAILPSSGADAQQTCSSSAVDDVVDTIRKSASKTREKYRATKQASEDESKGVKKLQASNPIAALVSTLQSEYLVQFDSLGRIICA